MTCSIVAVDRPSGHLGVAVQTCMPAVGAGVPWAEPGVGAVATQAFVDVSYGPRCLAALSTGSTPEEALRAAQAADPAPMMRQVAVVSPDGATAVTTGAACVGHAGHLAGDGFTVQGNMLGSPEVWPAMAAAFEASTGPLSHRLLAALHAGDAAGGDARGPMSAALVVVEGRRPEQPGAGRLVDLRVDRSTDPLGDLSELLRASDAYQLFDVFVGQLFGGDPAAALATITVALDALPGEGNFVFGRIGALLATAETSTALRELRALTAERASWAELFRAFVHEGLMALPSGMSVDEALASAVPIPGPS